MYGVSVLVATVSRTRSRSYEFRRSHCYAMLQSGMKIFGHFRSWSLPQVEDPELAEC